MKKILFLTVASFFAAGTVYASEMIVELKSGNTVVIQCSGEIESVILKGDSDAIVGMKMRTKQEPDLSPQSEKSSGSTSSDSKVAKTESSDEQSSVRFKWARPLDEENLKNVRSGSKGAD